MSYYFYPSRHTCLGAHSSDLTGAVWYSGDMRQITVSIQSSTGSASRYTIVGTDDDGFRTALGTPSQTIPANGWSVVTTITSQGIYTIDPGVRWLNAFRDAISASVASNVSITFAGRT